MDASETSEDGTTKQAPADTTQPAATEAAPKAPVARKAPAKEKTPAKAETAQPTVAAEAATTSQAPAAGGLTKKQVAAMVKRTYPVVGKDGKPTGLVGETPILENEVFDFREFDDHVVVVTVDGQKFAASKAATK